MNIFKTIQLNLAIFGYKKNLRPFNKRQNTFLSISFLSVLSITTYLFYVANTPEEYLDSIYLVCVGNLMIISHFSTILKTKTVFVLIDEVEEVINKSEF